MNKMLLNLSAKTSYNQSSARICLYQSIQFDIAVKFRYMFLLRNNLSCKQSEKREFRKKNCTAVGDISQNFRNKKDA